MTGQPANMGLVAISHGERAKVLQLTAQSILRQVDGAAKIMLSSSKDSLEHLKTARIFFERGMVREAGRTTIVSGGIGTSVLPFRFGAPADFWIVTMGPLAHGTSPR